ncbi:MAG: exodeoxyribonuclease V subunit gamma [Oleispira sp.]|nr:exodeoxyribonuclease V subunit gamma [Oleispira sp.]
MFKLYHSNDLDVLKELLVHQMKQGDSDPFISEKILVQSQGMAHWLKLQVAESLGIAANIEFPLPSSFVWKVYNSVKPDLPERSHFEKESMTWKLTRLLPTLLDEELFAPIAHYLKVESGEISQQKVFALAEKIADTFDQYLVYRPDWLLEWEAGKDEIKDGDISNQPWQPELWRRLVADSEQLGHSLFHRARLTDQLVDIVRDGKEGLKDLLPTSSLGHPSRIFVFGIAALPGTYWQVLNAISEHVDVHFFLLNPCKNYWGDIINEKTRAKLLQKDASLANYFTVGNPLLASWGKLGRDFVTLTHEAANESGRERYFQDIEAFVDSRAADDRNLLQNIKNDFLELNNRSEAAFGITALENSQAKVTVKKNDQSIQFVSAHSPLREVQTLFDQMLSWFDQDALANNEKFSNKEKGDALKPRDILVMVPDIDIYAPYIEAVFGSAANELRIPWAIADQALNKENLIIDSFLRLLQLPSSRLTITDVLEFLEVPAIGQKFEIELQDLDQIKHWLTKANIRWGLDGYHREDLGLPSWDDNSWFKGLQQLILGLVMPDNAHALDQHWPVPGVMGSQGELLGKFMAFVDQLGHWYDVLSEQKKPQQLLNKEAWQDLLLNLIADFYPQQAHDENSLSDQVVLQKVRDQILRWQQELELAAFNQGISHGVVLQYLSGCLTKQVGWQRFLAGPVNFCTLMPMRSIPFKIVCMLGMNDEDYPRRVPPQGFDLMAQGQYRRGDRSRREDDRYLFLEAVIAAQEKLYISYRGRDSRENNELQPCVLVSELIDYIANGYVISGDEALPHKKSEKSLRKHLISEQLLQPFNAKYFSSTSNAKQDESKQLQSYQKIWQQVASVSNDLARNEKPPFIVQALSDDRDSNIRLYPELDDIKQCLMNPAKFFMQRRLNVNLTQYWDETEVDEPFSLDNLQSYLLNEAILTTHLEGRSELFKQQQKSLGNLPAAGFAEYVLSQSENKIAPLIEELKSHLPNLEKMPPQSDSFTIAEYQLNGQLEHLMKTDGLQQVFHFRSGGFKAKQIVNLWLEHLFACACVDTDTAGKRMGNSIGLGIDKEGCVEKCEFTPLAKNAAQQYLLELIEFMNLCYTQPQPFFLSIAFAYLTAEAEKREGILNQASDSEFSQLNDEFVQRCFSQIIEEDEFQFLTEQTSLWQSILQPLLDHTVTDRDEEGESK